MYIRPPYPNELYHHGIKGQKWGIRRFQNPDGSLTAAGKKRYYNSEGKMTTEGLVRLRKDVIDINTSENYEVGKIAVEQGMDFGAFDMSTEDWYIHLIPDIFDVPFNDVGDTITFDTRKLAERIKAEKQSR